MAKLFRTILIPAPLLLLACAAVFSQGNGGGTDLRFNDPSGVAQTYTTNARVDTRNPFFQVLGSNGRTCATCHVPADGWTLTPADLQARFAATGGLDPVFDPNDGTNSPNADQSTLDARRAASSMLLTKGLIRIGMGIPANAQFSLIDVDDPYGYASAAELSLFRRPLPATNLRFLSAVMWDGRENVQPIKGDTTASTAALIADLSHQALDATLGHGQAAQPPTQAQLQQIVAFEMGLYTTQSFDVDAGDLRAGGAQGGAAILSTQPFHIGINDTFGNDPTGAPFDPVAMHLYDAWANSPASGGGMSRVPFRQAVARGQAIFNGRTFQITGVGGLNDSLGVASITGTCTSCHNAPNAGDHSVALALNIGTADASRRTPDMPLYTLQNNTTGETVQTTDPGRALITGKWADIGKFKGPVLRALATRAPYFHNGSAASLRDVVEFYNTRFSIGLSAQEKSDLVAFLRTL